MNITYLLFVHDNPSHVYRLIKRLETPNTDFFLHIDSKTKDDFSSIVSLSNVHVASKRFSIDWGGISMVEALLFCCSELLKVYKGGVVVFLSGYDYPIKNNEYIHSYLSQYREFNFVAASPIGSKSCSWLNHGKRRVNCYALRLSSKEIATIEPGKIDFSNMRQFAKVCYFNPPLLWKAFRIFCFYPKRVHPGYLKAYGGEFWWVLSYNSIRKIVDFSAIHPDFLNWHQNTSIPDELFIQTLAYNILPQSSIKNTCLRYIHWKTASSPDSIQLEDMALIEQIVKEKDFLFARKILDDTVCECIDKLV